MTLLGRPSVDNNRFFMAGTLAATAGSNPSSLAEAQAAAVCPAGIEPAC